VIRILPIFCIALLSALLTSANAAPITFQFSGSVAQVPLDEVFGDIAVGDAIQGSYTFDSSAADLIPADPAAGSYTFAAPFGMNVSVGAHNFATSGSLNIGIVNSFVDQYTVLATSPSGDLTLELFLQDNTGAVFSDDRLPLILPSLAAFAQRDFHLDGLFAGREVQVDGQLTAPPPQVVPEPSLADLFLAGSITLLGLARRKRFLQ